METLGYSLKEYNQNLKIEKIIPHFRDNPERTYTFSELQSITKFSEVELKAILALLGQRKVIIYLDLQKMGEEEYVNKLNCPLKDSRYIFNRFKKETDIARRTLNNREARWFELGGKKEKD